jgi:4-amino-4-deoxy-L-arabinose transferase-like glycosyltransferase
MASPAAHLAILIALPLLLAFAWTGFTASDDGFYVDAAMRWIAEFPYVPDQFGLSRAVVSLPISAMYLLLGQGEFSTVLSTCLFYGALVLTTLNVLVPVVGPGHALAGALLLATTPLVLLKSTFPSADIPNLFFVALGFWLFWRASRVTDGQRSLLFASGVATGFAALAHEATAALVLFHLLLWLCGRGVPRARYPYLALGFALILLAESTYYWVVAGNPLHRLALLAQAAAIHDRAAAPFLGIAQGGTLHVWAPIDPLIMLLTHHNFALLGWLALPALHWVLRPGPAEDPELLRLGRLLLGLAACWFLVSALLLGQFILLPRYFMVPAYCLLMLAILWLSRGPRLRGLSIAGPLVAVVLLVNLLAVAIDYKHPRFAERELVALLGSTDGRVHTDPLTAYNSIWFCRWAGVDCTRLEIDPPGPGVLYYWNPRNTDAPNRMLGQDALAAYRPRPDWETLKVFVPPPDFLSTAVAASGLGVLLPEAIGRKLARRGVRTTLYRIPAPADPSPSANQPEVSLHDFR